MTMGVNLLGQIGEDFQGRRVGVTTSRKRELCVLLEMEASDIYHALARVLEIGTDELAILTLCVSV